MTKTLKVTKSNELIRASYRLTLLELRIILFGISKINPMRELPARHEVSCHDIAEFYNLETRNFWQEIKHAFCERFFERKIIIKDNERTVISRWIYELEIDEAQKIISYVYNPSILPHLSQLEKRFTTYGLKYISKMASIYSIRFYEWSIMQLNASQKQSITFQKTVEELKEDLALEGKYKQLGDFKKYVLNVAKEEISDLTNITFDYIIEKQGHHIKYIEFSASFKPNQPEEKPMATPPQQPLQSPPLTPTPSEAPKKSSGEYKAAADYVPAAWMPRLDQDSPPDTAETSRAAAFKEFAAQKTQKEAQELKTTRLSPDEVDSTTDCERLNYTIKERTRYINEIEAMKPDNELTLKNLDDERKYLAQAMNRRDLLATDGYQTDVPCFFDKKVTNKEGI